MNISVLCFITAWVVYAGGVLMAIANKIVECIKDCHYEETKDEKVPIPVRRLPAERYRD